MLRHRIPRNRHRWGELNLVGLLVCHGADVVTLRGVWFGFVY